MVEQNPNLYLPTGVQEHERASVWYIVLHDQSLNQVLYDNL